MRQLLQEDSYAVQYPKSFLVLDNSDIDAMLKIIYEERKLSLRDMTFAKARDMIEVRKIFTEPEYYQDMIAMSQEAIKEKYERAVDPKDIIFYGYLYQEKKCFGLDYNDLIKFTLYIFEQKEDLRLKWQQRFLDYPTVMALEPKVKHIVCPLGVGEYFEGWGFAQDMLHEEDWDTEINYCPLIVASLPCPVILGRNLIGNCLMPAVVKGTSW